MKFKIIFLVSATFMSIGSHAYEKLSNGSGCNFNSECTSGYCGVGGHTCGAQSNCTCDNKPGGAVKGSTVGSGTSYSGSTTKATSAH